MRLQRRQLAGSGEDSYTAASSLTGAIFSRPKSRTLAVPRFVTKMFGGLYIAVDNSLLVRRFQGVRDLDRDFYHAIDRKQAPLNQVFQRLALQELHGDERSAAFFGDFIDRGDFGMVQG